MENNLVCEFCKKEFVREKNFLKHQCEQMKRHDLFKTVEGHFAFLCFNNWRKCKKYPPVTVEVFATSRFFNSFVEFSRFSRSQNLPDTFGFIKLMTEKNIYPFYWSEMEIYDMYLKTFDEECPIEKKLQISIDTLNDLSERYECSMADLFDKVSAIDLLKMVTSRRISPWLLLPSKQFKKFIVNNTTEEEKMLFYTFIDIAKWKQQFDSNPEITMTVKNLNAKLGI